jgi:hypothetical protein
VGGDRIAIHHLLSHTAGMPDFMALEEAARLPRDGAPGERLNYSNLGYSALGNVVEKVAVDPAGERPAGGVEHGPEDGHSSGATHSDTCEMTRDAFIGTSCRK